MKTIIAGGRDYQLSHEDHKALNRLRESIPITEVVCGMARGADLGGHAWAKVLGIPIAEFPARWNLHGKRAGPMRNQEMAKYAEALVAFPGGNGTADMVRQALGAGLLVYVIDGDKEVVARRGEKPRA